MVTKEVVFQKIKDVLVEEFEVEEDDISYESSLYKDLEMDSLDAIDLMVTLDKELEVEIKTEEMKDLLTIDDVCNFVVAASSANE